MKETLGGLIGVFFGAGTASRLKFGVSVGIRGLIVGLLRLGLSVWVAFGAGDAHGMWAGVLAGIATWAILRYLQTLNINQQQQKQGELLDAMIGVSNLLADTRVSPSYLQRRMLAVADKGAVWPVGAIALVQHAVQRNPSGWNVT
jgi:hypothetical protein